MPPPKKAAKKTGPAVGRKSSSTSSRTKTTTRRTATRSPSTPGTARRKGSSTKLSTAAKSKALIAELAAQEASRKGVSLTEFAGRSCSAIDALMWAYENIGTDSGAKDAPSAGAWGLLQWAKRAPDKFYPEIIRLLGKKADLDLTSEGSREWTEEKVEHIDAFLQAIQDGRDDYSEGAGDEPAMEA